MNVAALRSRERHIRRGIAALSGLVLIVVAVPVVLIALSRALIDSPNPLSGIAAPWTWSGTRIKDAFTHAIDNATVISTISRVGLAIAWMALGIIVVSVAAELRSLRVHGIPLPKLHGIGWSQAIARRIAAGLLAFSTVLPTHVASAAPLVPRSVATLPLTVPLANQSIMPAVLTSVTEGGWTAYTVARGDSIYGIAGRLANGDRIRTREIAQEILDRNLGRVMSDGARFTTPGVIQIGWILDIPIDRDAPVAPPSSTEAPPPVEEMYTVQRGDSYWDIADHHLEIVLGREPSPREVLDETQALMNTNVEHLGNREPSSMIYSGDVLILPSPNGYQLPVEASPRPQPVPESATPPPPTTSPLPPPTAPPVPTVAPPPSPPLPVSSAPTAPVTTPPSTADIRDSEEQGTPAPNPWAELAIGSLFATGMTATVTRLRRRRLSRRTPGHRLAGTTGAAADTETVMHAESKPDRMEALRRLLGALTGHTRLEGTRPLVRAVQLTETSIELLWTEAQPSPARYWTTTDGGWSWRTPWPDDPSDRHSPAPPILPALVSIGVRADGAELLLDLETAGSLSIEGDPELVAAFTNQLVLSLGASPLADNIDLVAVDLAVPGAEYLERVRTSKITTATQWLTTRSGETDASLTKAKATTTLAARLLGRANDEWEPIVVIAPSADDETVSRLVDTALPGSGSIAVVRDTATAGERIVLHSHQKAEWVRLGLELKPHLVTPQAGADVAELLSTIEDSVEVEVALNDSPIEVHSGVILDADDLSGPAPRCYDVLVRVLGEVEVEGVDEHLTDAEVELLALLATVRPDGPINLDRLATLLAHDEWRTPKPRSIQARISHLRGKLGDGTDGMPLVPDSRASTGSPSRYLISPRVVTDIDVLDHAYRLADNLPSSEAVLTLRQAFELVRGKPYTARSGYTWAYDEHAAARAEQVVGDVAARLIDLYGQAGDAAGIQWVIQRARRGLDGTIAELPHRLVERVWATRLSDPGVTESTAKYERDLAAAVDDDDPNGDYEMDERRALWTKQSHESGTPT